MAPRLEPESQLAVVRPDNRVRKTAAGEMLSQQLRERTGRRRSGEFLQREAGSMKTRAHAYKKLQRFFFAKLQSEVVPVDQVHFCHPAVADARHHFIRNGRQLGTANAHL